MLEKDRDKIRGMIKDNAQAIHAAKMFTKALREQGLKPPPITAALVDIFERLDRM